jgi:YgiT-type zinc finger domain-containing protein
VKCTRCGSRLVETQTDLPFKIDGRSIVVIKGIPVLECASCPEYLLPDASMKRVEEILRGRTPAAELEVIRFAA